MSALIFIIILSFLVLIHEAGHFLLARWSKIKVEEFGLGYPPRALMLFKDKLGTIYSLNWLPFGGFVRMFGEDGVTGEDTPEVKKNDHSTSGVKDKGVKGGEFFQAPVGKRFLVVVAGATINFIFGVIAFGAIYSRHGIPTDLNAVKVEDVAANSPAAEAGITKGSYIIKASQESQSVDTSTSQALITFVQQQRGKKISLSTREGTVYDVYVRKPEETPQGQGALGVTLTDFELKYYPWWQMPFRGMWVGLKAATNFGGLILEGLGKMVGDLFTRGTVPTDVAGPVGIVYAAEKEGFLRTGFWTQLNFAAILSINLAIVNLLPFPALDGGRAVFILWEAITKKRIKPQIEAWLNTAGFILLLTLIMLISLRDIGRVVMDQGVRDWFGRLVR